MKTDGKRVTRMDNDSLPFHFNFTMFLSIGLYRYPVFVFCLLLYSFIICANLVILLVVVREKTLHQPMYVFISCLSLNGLYGSGGFFPRFLYDLLSDSHLISRPACFTQIYIIYTYASNELTILSVMAYDRYVAVCHPLHYHRRMSPRTVNALLLFAVLCPACNITVTINMVLKVPLCGDAIQKVYCASWNVVKLSCNAAVVNNQLAMLGAVVIAVAPLSFILYTYVRILVSCWKMSAEVRGKLLNSCLPHVVSFAVYSVTSFSDAALSRQNLEEVNPLAAIILSLEFIVIPPLLNPLVYGFKLPEIRKHIFVMLRFKRLLPKKPCRSSPECT